MDTDLRYVLRLEHLKRHRWILTVNSLVEQQQELSHSTVHLLPVEVKQGHHLEVHLSEKVGQLVDVRDGSTQLGVVVVVHVAHQESNFVRS